MKLELKHLAPYLPYRLKVYHSAFMFRSNWNENEIGLMVGATDNIQNKTFDIVMIRERDKYKLQDSRNHFKPILRPLSDLTEEIEHNGEKFVPLRKLEDLFPCVEFYNDDELSYLFSDTSCNGDMYHSIELSLTLEISSKLFEWHFDVFGLIEKGLAIDINTLENV